MTHAANPAPKFTARRAHLLKRVQQRKITGQQLTLMVAWLDREPEVPTGKWFKRSPGAIVCGEGEFIKTFLTPDQVPVGDEILDGYSELFRG